MERQNIHISSARLEEIVINAFEWAAEVSDQTICDLIRATGITSDELDAIGYDEENHPSMHKITS